MRANYYQRSIDHVCSVFCLECCDRGQFYELLKIDATIFQQNEQKLEKFWSFSLESKGLDAYLVEVYHENENQFENITQKYRTLWENRFGRGKSGLQKGFLEINFRL
jgi:hypothetical protein